MSKTVISIEKVAAAGSLYDADYDLACATLLQCADEIDLITAAIRHPSSDVAQTVGALLGISLRMRMAARIAADEVTSNG
ncbi:MAG TPA: hypothetical protein VFK05_12560 [Polyangiaceae bacterium]|nr:hypothetical protein [Polyangiaceae bacterium]